MSEKGTSPILVKTAAKSDRCVIGRDNKIYVTERTKKEIDFRITHIEVSDLSLNGNGELLLSGSTSGAPSEHGR